MQNLQDISQFFISAWLWHFTWGWIQVVCSLLFVCFFLRTIANISWLRATILSSMAHICVSFLFSAIVAGFLIHGCELDTSDTERYMIIYTNRYYVTFSFALVYGTLLSLFFICFNYAYRMPLCRVLVAVIIGTLSSALVTPILVRF